MGPRAKFVVSGASGLVGGALCASLAENGADVVSLVRDKSRLRAGTAYWNPGLGKVDTDVLEGAAGVIHLAGENIAGARWTDARKDQILKSRVDGTTLLATACARLRQKPAVFVSASAIGFYGSRGSEQLTETAGQGKGFLADVCGQWEAAARPAADTGIRTVLGRLGVVLSSKGGALEKMKRPFLMGLGGKIGNGTQYMSWISLPDLIRALMYVLHEDVSGPVNLVAPEPVTNAAFTKALGRALHRPTFLPVPKFALRMGAGEMADEMLLSSARVLPRVLTDRGFTWRHPDVDTALEAVLQ